MQPGDLPFRPGLRAAYLPGADALVLADLHLGRGEVAGVAMPLPGDAVERLETLLARWTPETVVLAGDVVHGPVTSAVSAAIDALRAVVVDAELRIVAGNHDVRAGDRLDAGATHRLGDGTLVCHGHEAPTERAPRYVVGHDHPAIVIEGRRHPCFLYGEGVYRGSDVLALPAFDRLARGTAVNRLDRGDPASPLLANVGSFRPVVRDGAAGETYVFPPLSTTGPFL